VKELLGFLFSLPPMSIYRRRYYSGERNEERARTLSPDTNDRAGPIERLMLFHQGGCVGLGRISHVSNCGLGWAKNEL